MLADLRCHVRDRAHGICGNYRRAWPPINAAARRQALANMHVCSYWGRRRAAHAYGRHLRVVRACRALRESVLRATLGDGCTYPERFFQLRMSSGI